jgi:hypothetical protein
MPKYIVVATNPDCETSQAVGPLTSGKVALRVCEYLEENDWATEIVQLTPVREIDTLIS